VNWVEETSVSRSPEETRALGFELSRQLEPGDLLAFKGDLGTGKTCMIQGICQGLEVADWVNSPTFILINEYVGKKSGQEVFIYHFDLYRLQTQAELEDLGAEDYFYGQGICLVEWAERAGDLLPPLSREIILEHSADEERRITLKYPTP
jgi:tRNA threonylcarbamoyladenosine biosynthesis protein TsaE